MNPAIVMALLWLVFAVSHVGVAASPLRARLIERFGRARYLIGYIVVAQALFAVLPIYYATNHDAGPAGPALGHIAALRVVLIASIVVGFVLVVGALAPAQYVSSTNPFSTGVRQPFGLERVTRHPIFVGLGMWAAAHALLATKLIGTVFFGSFAALAILGTLHQERKLVRDRGPDYERYLASTSFVPFVAILAGRQKLAAREQPWPFLVLGLGVVWLLRSQHANLLAWNGAGMAAFFFLATTYFTVEGARRARLARLESAKS